MKLPLTVFRNYPELINIHDDNGEVVAWLLKTYRIEAEHIVRAVNAHKQMVDTLSVAVTEMDAWMLERTPNADDIDALRLALRDTLKLARGEA